MGFKDTKTLKILLKNAKIVRKSFGIMAFPHTKSFKVEKNLKLPSIFSNKKSSIFEKVKKNKKFQKNSKMFKNEIC